MITNETDLKACVRWLKESGVKDISPPCYRVATAGDFFVSQSDSAYYIVARSDRIWEFAIAPWLVEALIARQRIDAPPTVPIPDGAKWEEDEIGWVLRWYDHLACRPPRSAEDAKNRRAWVAMEQACLAAYDELEDRKGEARLVAAKAEPKTYGGECEMAR